MDRNQLEKPFDSQFIKQREGDDGKMYDYVQGKAVIQRLNEIFNAEWDFEVIEFKILENEVVVLGKLLAGGHEKMQFGSVPITRRRSDRSIISVGDDLKKAGTDSLKKCATMFGVALNIETPKRERSAAPSRHFEKRTDVQTVSPVVPPAPAAVATPTSNSDRITAKQISAITRLSEAKGWTQRELQAHITGNYRRPLEQLSIDQGASLIARLQLQQEVAS